jgi:hypothetical protein
VIIPERLPLNRKSLSGCFSPRNDTTTARHFFQQVRTILDSLLSFLEQRAPNQHQGTIALNRPIQHDAQSVVLVEHRAALKPGNLPGQVTDDPINASA